MPLCIVLLTICISQWDALCWKERTVYETYQHYEMHSADLETKSVCFQTGFATVRCKYEHVAHCHSFSSYQSQVSVVRVYIDYKAFEYYNAYQSVCVRTGLGLMEFLTYLINSRWLVICILLSWDRYTKVNLLKTFKEKYSKMYGNRLTSSAQAY